MTADEVAAREAIRDLVARYNANGDSGRFEQVLALFTENAVIEVPGETCEGRAAIAAMFDRSRAQVKASSGLAFLRHFTATHQIDLIDADHARGRCYFLVLMLHGIDHWGRYVDDYARVDSRWYFARRVVTVDGRAEGSVFS
jgi:ketosteroid isomerase-like protein